jgi:hypothetical protein
VSILSDGFVAKARKIKSSLSVCVLADGLCFLLNDIYLSAFNCFYVKELL